MADVIFLSSGSTGEPKEIIRSEASLAADARHLIKTFPEVWGTDPRADTGDTGDRPLVVASVHPDHMYGALWRVRAPAVAGFAIEPKTIISVEEITDCATRNQTMIFVTTPSFLEKAINHADFAQLKGRFRAITTSGGPLRRETALTVQDVTGVCPLEIYGSTEAGTVAWRRQCDGAAFTLVPGVSATLGTDPQKSGTDPLKSVGTDPSEGTLVVDSPFAMARPLVMGDCVQMVGSRQFLLKGRADRRVKILERYVSLTAVERSLAAHPFVDDVRVEPYGEGVTRLGALIVASEAGRDAALRGGHSAVAAELRRALRAAVGDVAVPRRFRLVRVLPVNERGKTTAAAVRAALVAWCREPVVQSWRATVDELTAELVFTAELECFQGHFPGFPILPGVAQLYFLRHFARQAFADWPEAATFRKLKFQKIIRPGVPVTMTVLRRGEGAFAFELAIASGRATSGTVEATTANS